MDTLFRTIDLALGEEIATVLTNGVTVTLKLLGMDTQCDELRQAIRHVDLKVAIDGQTFDLCMGNYHMPITAEPVRIDCPITRLLAANVNRADRIAIRKDARFRLWPADSPLTPKGTFMMPIKQRLFCSATQMGHAPTWVDAGENPAAKGIYYHNGLDFGGADGIDEVISSSDGIVICRGDKYLEEHCHAMVEPRYDRVYVLDAKGWRYKYSHLDSIDPGVTLGAKVTLGQTIGHLGKEGGSGGWAHLHYDVAAIAPTGEWDLLEAYPFVVEDYCRRYRPGVVAIARPQQLIPTGGVASLDGSRSFSSCRIATHEWILSDGTRHQGAQVQKRYEKKGEYSETLKVTDERGRVSYDFATILVKDPTDVAPGKGATRSPYFGHHLHLAAYPTLGLAAGTPVTVFVRVFSTEHGEERLDFGDGSSPVFVKSHEGKHDRHFKPGYAMSRHVYDGPGYYIVTASRDDEEGATATQRIWVHVD